MTDWRKPFRAERTPELVQRLDPQAEWFDNWGGAGLILEEGRRETAHMVLNTETLAKAYAAGAIKYRRFSPFQLSIHNFGEALQKIFTDEVQVSSHFQYGKQHIVVRLGRVVHPNGQGYRCHYPPKIMVSWSCPAELVEKEPLKAFGQAVAMITERYCEMDEEARRGAKEAAPTMIERLSAVGPIETEADQL